MFFFKKKPIVNKINETFQIGLLNKNDTEVKYPEYKRQFIEFEAVHDDFALINKNDIEFPCTSVPIEVYGVMFFIYNKPNRFGKLNNHLIDFTGVVKIDKGRLKVIMHPEVSISEWVMKQILL